MAVKKLKNSSSLSIKSQNLKDNVANATTLLAESVYYVDALYPTGTSTTPGYVYLNGTVGNYMSTPDAAALDITGDIDIRLNVAMDDWTPSTLNVFCAKRTGTNTQFSFVWYLNTNGTIAFAWTPTGSGANAITATSSSSNTFADGSRIWLRVTLDVDNGSSQNEVKFYTSTDGNTWTQFGNTITNANTTSIYSGTAVFELGSQYGGTGTEPARGKFYRAQIRNGIDGTVAFDANMSNVSQTATSFTESSSNAATVTIYGFRAYPQDVANLGTAGALLPTTLGSSTAADSNDPRFLDHTGTNYVYTPGASGNFLSVPDEAALDITGDIDLRAQVALDDWTPSVRNTLLVKGGSTNVSYRLDVDPTTGNLRLVWTTDGTTASAVSSTAAPTITDGSNLWVRATLDVDNGASGRDIKFFTSSNGSSWTQLGTTVTQAGVTSVYSGSDSLKIGINAATTGEPLTGKVFRAQVLNGIDGTTVLDVDTSVITAGSATSFTAVTGQTVTINRSTSGRKTVAVTQPLWLLGTDDYMEVNNRYMASGTYLYLPGIASNNATAPDAAPLDITGDIDIRCKVALDDWTPGATGLFLGKWQTSLSYQFYITSTNLLAFAWSENGTGNITKTSTVAPTVSDGATLWVRVTLDVDNGASGNDVKFWTSSDGTNWTQLGSTVTTAGVTSIFSGSSGLTIGSSGNGANPIRGDFFRAQIRNGIDGTVAFDANFETSITSLNQATFTESSTNAATVTINRSGSTYRSAGITTAGYLYPGATNTFSASATDFLNFGTGQSFTALALVRKWATPPNFGMIMAKRESTASTPGWDFSNNSTGTDVRGLLSNGPTNITYTLGTNTFNNATLSLVGVQVNRGTQIARIFVNNVYSSGTAISTVSDSTTVNTFRFGSLSNTQSIMDMELIAGAVWRRTLLAPEIAAIANYFASRGS